MTLIRTFRDAELNAAKHMRSIGISDAEVTGNGADGGIDVRSAVAIAQVKFLSIPVGRPDLQRLVGARAGNERREMLFYSKSGYTRTALEYANAHRIALYTFDTSGTVTAVNTTAKVTGSKGARDVATANWIEIREANAATWAAEYQAKGRGR